MKDSSAYKKMMLAAKARQDAVMMVNHAQVALQNAREEYQKAKIALEKEVHKEMGIEPSDDYGD